MYEAVIELFVEEFGYDAIKKVLGFMVSIKTPINCVELSNMSGSSEYMIRSLSMVLQKIIEKEPDYFYCNEEVFREVVNIYFSINHEYENLISSYYHLNKCVNMIYNTWGGYESAIFDLENMASYYEVVENYRLVVWHLEEASPLRYQYGETNGYEDLTEMETKPFSFTKKIMRCL